MHVEDVARLYVAALQARPGSVYAGVGGVNPTAKEVAVALSRAAGLGDGVKSMTMEDAAEQMGPVADAFALDQQLSSARAQSELDWDSGVTSTPSPCYRITDESRTRWRCRAGTRRCGRQ